MFKGSKVIVKLIGNKIFCLKLNLIHLYPGSYFRQNFTYFCINQINSATRNLYTYYYLKIINTIVIVKTLQQYSEDNIENKKQLSNFKYGKKKCRENDCRVPFQSIPHTVTCFFTIWKTIE